MDRTRVLVFMAATLFLLCLSAPAGAMFIGTAVDFNKHFGNSIDVAVGKNVNALDNTAFGVGAMNVGVDWGVDVGLGTAAGYPYGYGGLGTVTQGGLGYSLGLTVDGVSGAGFDGSGFGIPVAQQGVTTTHMGQLWANNLQIDDSHAILPMSGFPVL